jgi:hypothetical protein
LRHPAISFIIRKSKSGREARENIGCGLQCVHAHAGPERRSNQSGAKLLIEIRDRTKAEAATTEGREPASQGGDQ